jgi:hypothetical protein
MLRHHFEAVQVLPNFSTQVMLVTCAVAALGIELCMITLCCA